MISMEASGVSTRFTHPSHLYKVFASKEWTAQMCLMPEFKVPLTSMIPRQVIACDVVRAAQVAYNAMQKLAEGRDVFAGRKPGTAINKGVCKLGWSWEARDVMSWTNTEEIKQALQYLGEQPGSHMDSVFIQEWVDFDVEMRCFVVEPHPDHPASWKPRKIVYTVFQGNEGNCFRSFMRWDRAGAIANKFNGDEEAMAMAERLSEELIAKWIYWFQAQSAELPIFTRFDILAKHTGPGQASVHTGELTELGGCFLGWQEGPKTVFRAITRSCFGRYPDFATGRHAADTFGIPAV